MFKLFGGRKKAAKARSRKAGDAPRTPPGEGIRQLAAALPHSDDPPAAPPAAKARTAAPQTTQPAPAAKPARDPAARDTLIREAMRIRRDKAKDLEELPARERKKLRLLAEKMMGVEPAGPSDSASGETPPKDRGPSGTRH